MAFGRNDRNDWRIEPADDLCCRGPSGRFLKVSLNSLGIGPGIHETSGEPTGVLPDGPALRAPREIPLDTGRDCSAGSGRWSPS